MEAEDTEYLKLPLEDRCIHKLWKARVNGYEECTKHFATLDEKAPEFNKFAPLMKKFVTDSNAIAQEKALDAVIVFASNAHVAGRTTADVTSGIVAKCLAAPKRTTQEKALDVILMYCEIEKYDAVEEELIKGFAHKNPKVVAGSVKAVSTALREFGSKVMAIKPLVKVMGTLIENRDKNVREEAKKMVVEMYRWVGPALKSQLSSLKPIQMQELEAEFDKLGNEKPVQSRLLRSQQEVEESAAGDPQQDDKADECDGEEGSVKEADPLDFTDPVNILDQLPKDFFEKVEAKKWQERKEAMDILLPLTQIEKLEAGDYGDLVKALKKIIAKDTNVMIIALAGQCVTGLAKGLKKKFSPYAIVCTDTILEKFKEKKTNVITALREAADAVFHSTTLDALQEVVISALKNKNPNVKAETAGFLARSFCYCTPTILTKKILKIFTTELLRALSESDPTVRDNAAEALGTLLRVVGEKTLGPFIADLDALKMQKVKEYSEKAEIKVKISAAKPKPKPAPAPIKEPSKPASVRSAGAAIGPKKIAGGKPKKPGEPKGVKGGGGFEECYEMELSLEEALERAAEILPQDVISGLSDTNWKIRFSATEKFNSTIQDQELNKLACQALVKTLSNKPGLKDNNFQIMKLKLDALKFLAEHSSFTRRSAEVVLQDLIDKLGDPKNGPLVMDVLSSIAEAAKFQWVGIEVINAALTQKNPKILEMSLKWLSEAIKEFGFILQVKALLPTIKSALGNSNPAVRTAAINLCGTIYMYLGPPLRSHFEDEKASLVQQIDIEFEKMGNETPPIPTRGQNSVASEGEMIGEETEGHAMTDQPDRQNKEKPKVKNPASSSGSKSKTERSPPTGGAAGARGAAVKKGLRAPSAGRSVPSSKKEEEVDSSPLLEVNDQKHEREREERRLKTLKWDFALPRQEFITQLKDQLTNGNANGQLISNMFHQDFRFHIKAIDGLIEDLPTNVDACISNLDLVLRWLTIRFFDTNPSVIIKGMDYLQQVFTLLSDKGYHLTELEASSFLPYLITKFGEPKNSIRGPAREICKLICNIYPSSKVSPYILNGLRSKNARQRSECLEAIGSLIEIYGMTVVCQPSAGMAASRDNAGAIKEIAKQIADRDNSVRNAALNTLVQVYFREGDKVYKMIGNVSGKDLCLLEERIKRSIKNRPIIKKPTSDANYPPQRGGGIAAGRPNRIIPTPSVHPAPVLRDGNTNTILASAALEPSSLRRTVQRPLSGDVSNLNSRIHIDYELFEKLLDDKAGEYTSPSYQVTRPQVHLEEIPDMASILNDETTCPVRSRLKRQGITSAMGANIINANMNNEDNSQAINMVISQIATHEVETVITALSQLDEVIQSEERRPLLSRHVDQILIVATLQYRLVLNTKMADTHNKEECIRIYRSLTNCLMSIFNNKELGSKATRDVLHDTIHAVVSILLDSRLSQLDDGSQVIRALNVLVVRIIEKAQFTHIFSAVLKLLHESVGSSVSTKFTDLMMRCNWKCIRLLQERGRELDVVLILADVLDFMVAYPSHTWAEKPCSKPLRTIKTVIMRLVEMHGNAILSHIAKVPNSQGTELQKYIIKALNTQKSSVVTDEEAGTNDSNRLVGDLQNRDIDVPIARTLKKLSKSANSTLSEIFRKIGSKENTKEGLVQLYEFKLKNPDADIDSFLRKSSQFFQNYIEKGLKKVEMERLQLEGGGSKMSTSASSDGSLNSVPLTSLQVQDSKGVNFNELVDQFKVIAAQAGFDNNYIDSAVKDMGMKE